MATPGPKEGRRGDPAGARALYLVRTLRVPRDEVWRAFTVPRELRRWWGPEEGYSVADVEIEPRVGGTLRLGMKPQGEPAYYVGGRVLDVQPGTALAFTWEWEGERTWAHQPSKAKPTPTTVTLQLKERSGMVTELFLVHEGFADERDREDHRWGWNGTLDRLRDGI